jgi:uncharacterized membrane protein (UPF0127 family)
MRIENSGAARQNLRMKIWKWAQALALVGLIGVGCGSADRPAETNSKSTAASPTTNLATPNAASDRKYPTEAQPKLRTIKLWIGADELVTEIAHSPKEIETGMMHRKSMEENEGMLFVFDFPRQTSFWMKNTLVPLSCAYIDPEGVILELHDMKPLDESPIPAGTDRVQFVLEVKKGWFERHNVKPGARIRTERGTLQETFFRPR